MTDKPISIHIDPAATPEQMKNLEPLSEFCPKCRCRTEMGFGLAGGGYGVYVYCLKCDYFAKHQVEE